MAATPPSNVSAVHHDWWIGRRGEVTADKGFLRAQVEASIGVVTVLNPLIGYDAATSIARQALSGGHSVTSLVLESGLLTANDLDEILRPERLANPQAHVAERVPNAVATEA
jgi:aspartate ammonia-lyase